MNPRFKELAEQCRWQEIVIEDGEEWIHAHFDEHKFAELIVRECMSLVSEPGPDMNDTERGILSQIKQHFGVEE